MKEKTADEMTDMYIFKEKVIKQIVKRDDEYTKQIIKDYVRNKYPKENIRIDFLDEEVVEKIIVHKDYFEWQLNFLDETLKLKIREKGQNDCFIEEYK